MRDYAQHLIKTSQFKDDQYDKIYELFLYYEINKIKKLVYRKDCKITNELGESKTQKLVTERERTEISNME